MFHALKEIFSRDKTYPSVERIQRFFEPLEYAGKIRGGLREQLQGALDATKPSPNTTTTSTEWDKESAKKQIWVIELLYAQLQVINEVIEREYLRLLARKGKKGEIVMVEEVWTMLDGRMEMGRGQMREVATEVEEAKARLTGV